MPPLPPPIPQAAQPNPPTRVLLAAGDLNTLRSAILYFPRDAFTPLAARSGHDASQGLGEDMPTIAVVHQTLNDMSGLELCQWLRQYSNAAILYLTDGLPPRNPQDPPYDEAIKFPPARPEIFNDTLQALVRQATETTDPLQEFAEEVLRRADSMQRQDYYALLGLSRTASHDAIRSSYDKLSLRFHPDQNFALRDHPAFPALNSLYKRIGEAYRTLTSSEKRAQYNKMLTKGVLRYDEAKREKEGPKSLEDLSDNPRVKRFLKLAQVALAAKNYRSALQNLKFAHSLERNNEDLAAKVEEIKAKV